MPKDIDISASMQDYLEAIVELEESNNSIRITDIANKLKIAKASVNQTINKLKEMGFVRQQTYGPVELTDAGRDMANKVLDRHKILSRFLVEVLGVDEKIAEKDACLMEHVISPQTMERLTDFVYTNVSDKKNLNSSIAELVESKNVKANNESTTKSLSDLKVGEKGTVIKVSAKGSVRRRLMEMGIITRTEVFVKGFAPFGDPMELGIKGYSLSLRKAEAADILVELS